MDSGQTDSDTVHSTEHSLQKTEGCLQYIKLDVIEINMLCTIVLELCMFCMQLFTPQMAQIAEISVPEGRDQWLCGGVSSRCHWQR